MAASGLVERNTEGFVRFMARAMESERLARANGLLQRLDPRVKIVGVPALIVAAVISRRIALIAALFLFGVVLGWLSKVPLRAVVSKIWIAVLGFTGVIAIPAIFITPGEVIYRLPVLNWPVTAQGLRSAAFLISRTETAATLALLLVLCTPWTHIMKASRILRVPAVVVVIVGMTYRYIFLLLETAREMFESRRSRTVGVLDGRERRALVAGIAGVLMGKSLQLSDDVYMAMQSRGFSGEVYLLHDFAFKVRDYIAMAAFLGISVAVVWFGR